MKVIAHASDEKGAERVSRLWEPRLACGLPKTIEQLIKLVGREEVGHLTEGGGRQRSERFLRAHSEISLRGQ